MKIVVETPIEETPRVMQVRGIFDLTAERTSRVEWDVSLPLHERAWNIGLVVGPSGCGKSTIARHLWPDAVNHQHHWPSNQAIVDAFPEELSIKTVAEILSSVGFSSPPAWLRPYRVLSTGQQFRVTLARLIADAIATNTPLAVLDEYSSVVDRTVAQIGSAALAKTIRKNNLQFVAITCHEDVEAWLDPDWVYRPAERTFAWRSLQGRPAIDLEVFRCDKAAWELFAPHHYLSDNIIRSAYCFLATWAERPVAFSAWLPFVGGGPPTRREHRTVTLPDYQGVGIGNVLSATIASMWRALGYRATSTTTHPAMIRHRSQSPLWALARPPALAKIRRNKNMYTRRLKHAFTRMTAGFTYIGPPMPKITARKLLG